MNEQILNRASTLRDAVEAIEKSVRRIAVVVESGRLVGTLTDGDIRRCLLSGDDLNISVESAMNVTPVVADVDSSEGFMAELLLRNNLRALPLVDAENNYIRTVHITELHEHDAANHLEAGFAAAVIMAGGEGTRLRPLTEKIPKPMVDIDGLPLLERQVSRLSKAGIRLIYLSINYLSEVIEEYFGDGTKFGVRIEYLRESEKLGTGGALSLLPKIPDAPILVMNGDILTTSDFRCFYDFHIHHKALVTVGAVNYRVEIPYGVIRCDGPNVSRLDEKPSQQFLCNGGIYALSPEILQELPSHGFFNMTDVVNNCLVNDRSVVVFPVHEYWTDIGTPMDLAQAREEFKNFADSYN